MSRPKPTKYERLRIDFAVEFKDAHDSIRFGGQEDFKALERAIFEVLNERARTRGIEALCNVSITFGMDNRKRDGKGLLVK